MNVNSPQVDVIPIILEKEVLPSLPILSILIHSIVTISVIRQLRHTCTQQALLKLEGVWAACGRSVNSTQASMEYGDGHARAA